MSAALASKKSEPSTSGVPTTVSTDEESSSITAVLSDQGSSSSTAVPLPLIDENGQSQVAVEIASNMMNESKGRDCKFEVYIIACIHCFISHNCCSNSLIVMAFYMMLLFLFDANRINSKI